MSKTQSLLKLYRAYVTDLVSVAPEKGGVFVCPICLGEFKENDVINKRLTDGHVWPEYVRKKSKQTNQINQRVLLCAECNTKAGSRGDKQMQLLERVREGEERGDIYGDRTIEVPINPGEKPIRLKGRIRRKSPNSMTITGELKDGKWVGASPDDFQRFKALLDQRISFSLIEYPHNEIKTELTGAGWITSAYLMAFHALGYRYILRDTLDPVREYILKSFDLAIGDQLDLPKHDDFCVREFNDEYVSDPELRLIIPVNEDTKVHLEVKALRYFVRLPFHYDPNMLLAWLVLRKIEVIGSPPAGKDPTKAPGIIHTRITCTKLKKHDCIFC